MCQNSKDVTVGSNVAPFPHKPPKTQVCLQTDNQAVYFNSHLELVVVW